MSKIVIWGASSHALVVTDIIEAEGRYAVEAYLDDVAEQRHGEPFVGARVYARADALAHFRAAGIDKMIVAVGDNASRRRLAARAKAAGFTLVSAVHPRAVVSRTAVVGEGTVVCAGSVVDPAVVIGANVIINTLAAVNHEARIGDGAHVGSHVCLAGLVVAGVEARIELGSVVARNVAVGNRTVVGARSLVLESLPDDVVAYGSPARVVRERK